MKRSSIKRQKHKATNQKNCEKINNIICISKRQDKEIFYYCDSMYFQFDTI